MGSVAQGKEAAFEALYARYADRMYAFFYKLLYQDSELSADFCQSLFLKVFEKAGSYNPDYKFSTWLYTIAYNLCKNEYRRVETQAPLRYIRLKDQTISPEGPTMVDNEIFRTKLAKALNMLDEKHRVCFILRYLEHKPIKEISTILACPQGTIKSRLHNVLKKLAVELEQFNPNKKNNRNENII